MGWKCPIWSRKFLDCLESFQMVWKVSGWSKKFLDGLESFHMVWKVSRLSGKFPDSLESFQTVWKVSGQSGKNYLHSLFYVQELYNNMSRKQFTLFWYIYVAKTIYALLVQMSRTNLRTSSGKFLRVKFCRPES